MHASHTDRIHSHASAQARHHFDAADHNRPDHTQTAGHAAHHTQSRLHSTALHCTAMASPASPTAAEWLKEKKQAKQQWVKVLKDALDAGPQPHRDAAASALVRSAASRAHSSSHRVLELQTDHPLPPPCYRAGFCACAQIRGASRSRRRSSTRS